MTYHHSNYDEVMQDAELNWLKKRRKQANLPGIENHNINGLALSGGGIRSAVFNLGIIQALEKHKKLEQVDVMSSVSGGGYIASALTWFKSKLPDKFPFGSGRQDHNQLGGSVINWLRSHSSFLTPGNGISKMSLFTAIFTGTLINLLILVPISIFSIYLANLPLVETSKFLGGLFSIDNTTTQTINFFDILWLSSLGLMILSMGFMLLTALSTGVNSLKNKRTENLRKCVTYLFSWGLLCQLISLIPFIHGFFEELTDKIVHTSFSISLLGTAVTWFSTRKIPGTNNNVLKSLLVNIGLMLACLGFFIMAFHYAKEWLVHPSEYLNHIFIGLISISFILALTCNINLISMHGYYRNRLRDAFMPYQLPSTENFQEQHISTWHEAQACYLAKLPHNSAPLHILNCNVELTGSKQPKYRNRAGDCFTFNPLFTGSDATGYASTDKYQNGEMDLATACAISGAAVATNTSQTRSKTLNFILGLLNLRLGCWLPNPNRIIVDKWQLKPSWYLYMFRDMFGAGLNETQKYIHLSDGGHFENLGVYELVRRRCQHIVSVDAGADPNFQFKDLAKLTELIRVDFGAKLTLDITPLLPDENGISQSAYVIGDITYSCGTKAQLIYIKSTLQSGLGADVMGYKKQNKSFPDQSTIDQFFDELQFEAYRELGFQIGHRLLKQQPQIFAN